MDMVGNWSSTQTTTESFTNITGDLRNLRTPAALEVGTIGYAYQSFRSPIFYDYDNTGYYCDPASSSRLNVIYCGDVYNDLGGWFRNYGATGIYNQSYGNHFYSDSANYWNVSLGGTGAGGIRIRDNHAGTVRGYLYADSSNNIGFLNSGGSWRARVVADDYFLADGSSIRGQIYYDSNDTGWYVDPSSTSNLNRISTVRTNNWLYLDNNYGHSVVGVYASTRYQGVWAMGDSYKLAADGTTTGNLYGLAWSYPSAGGAASNLASHGLLLLENGTFKGAWGGGSFRTPGDLRGTIFYDYDNTGYYLDPTSTTSLRTVGDWRADSASWTGEFNGKMQYHAGHWYIQSSSLFIFRSSSGANVMQCDNSGNVTFSGNVTAYSDLRLKENVRDLTGAQTYLDKISAKRFTWKDDGCEDIGFIAQDVEAAGLTEFVLETAEYDPNTESTSDPFKTLDYGRMVSVLWQAVKEQKSQITAMSAEINSLKERLH
jgi:hypothetical protein